MENFSLAELWSIVASVTSVVLAILAIGLSVYFFVINRQTEKDVSNSLTKIETQADLLSKITGRQLDRLTKFVTQQKSPSDPLEEMIKVITELPNNLISSLQQLSTSSTNEHLLNELVTCYIGLYFYCAQANFWAQLNIPAQETFDESNVVHSTARRIVNLSAADFDHIARMLQQIDVACIQNSPVAHLLSETRDSWRTLVLNTTQVFDLRTRN